MSRVDEIVQRLQNMETFNIHTINLESNEPEPWWEVTPDIVQSLVIRDTTIDEQVRTAAAQLAFWGRMSARCKRIWDIEERLFRIWKAKQYLKISNPEEKPEGWKKPSEKAIEMHYRTDPEYSTQYIRVERAEEAYNAASLIVEAFRALKDELRIWARRVNNEMQLSTP